ncbi:peptide-methionine (S)-S-oxide reductase MsrA [Paenibacillus sp. HB172176]|uniref:peptide-methionine (S)-S-oxide reductase MsrA n=1 Tax=Paenibacillus sp. HB172176 TaxID=2493690 RepID=UPI00143B3FFB|nr:peptide-methionine (S)-S-oxide reductase MsrA [Paenibacillus sp. HB172176]
MKLERETNKGPASKPITAFDLVSKTATFGMGCFWGPEALFGQLPGVIRTRTGYAGGTTGQPTYRELGDHTETVQIDYNEKLIAYDEILAMFWDNHNPYNINGYKGRQYQSLLFFHDEAQEAGIHAFLAEREASGLPAPDTEVAAFDGFYPAEARHQKYYLKRYPDALEKLMTLFDSKEELEQSTIAARLNGLAKGYTSLERIKNELDRWTISAEERFELGRVLTAIKW